MPTTATAPTVPATSTGPRLATYQEAIVKYANVQGNILKGHGRDHAAFLFIEFGPDAAQVRAWLKNALNGDGRVAITSTAKQLEDTLRYKEFRIPGDLFAMLLLTAAGLQALGQKVPSEPEQVAQPQFSAAFTRGMRAPETKELLTDPAPEEWEPGWFEAGSATPTPLHALLILADDDEGSLQSAVREVADQVAGGVGTLHLLEWGHALRNSDGNGIEHFGYADGVSQPMYLAEDMPNHHPEGAKDSPLEEGIDRWDPSAGPEKLVLVPDPAGSFGSFFVFRKLQQSVREFKEAEERLAQRLALAAGDEERAGAMLVGRFEDGTPVVERGSDGLINPIANNFNYDDDPNGSKCPFHAHIRKMNPRGETAAPGSGSTPADIAQKKAAQDEEKLRRLTRRGIPFGDPEEALKEDGKPVGLLFMCFVRNIAQQYEFIQKFWANNPDFLFNKNQPGLDPIIGQGERGKLRFNYTYGAAGCRQASFAQFVTMRGGEYFYAPSMNGLRKMAGLVG
jgi:Dyp-type peroxidase family